MDKPTSPDFNPYSSDPDPYGLGETPVKQPSQRNDKDEQCQGAREDEEDKPGYLADLLPMPFSRLAKVVSCCTGVGVLYLISAWDHGLIPGVNSPFASSSMYSDFSELYTLTLAKNIRELEAEACALQSNAFDGQIDALQYKYKARTGARYPHTECKKVSVR